MSAARPPEGARPLPREGEGEDAQAASLGEVARGAARPPEGARPVRKEGEGEAVRAASLEEASRRESRAPLPWPWRAAVTATTLVAFALLAWVAAHWIWRWASPRPAPVAASAPADPAATILASGLWSGGGDAPAVPGAPAPGDWRLMGVLAEPGGKGLAVFRTRDGARVVAAGAEIVAGTSLVSIGPSGVTVRDAAGERTVELKRESPAKAGSPPAPRAPAQKTAAPAAAIVRPAVAAPGCSPPAGFAGPILKLHAELLDGLIAQPDSWRAMLAADNGALIVREEGGFATMIGLARGDRIVQANGIALMQPDDVTGAVLRPLVANQPVRIAGTRSGQPREVFIVNAGACP